MKFKLNLEYFTVFQTSVMKICGILEIFLFHRKKLNSVSTFSLKSLSHMESKRCKTNNKNVDNLQTIFDNFVHPFS